MASLQKRLASRILKVGTTRIWLDPKQKKDIEGAITSADVRKMIQKGYIKKLPSVVSMPREFVPGKGKRRKREKRGQGRRGGAKHSIVTSKRKWISTVRPLRRMLKHLKGTEQIDNETFKHLYKLVKGGTFRSRSHLKIYLEQHGLIKKKQ
jgi:large subunit ribosomal protein L19e